MSTVAQARAALVAAVGATDGTVEIVSNGTDFAGAGGSNVIWGFRVVCMVGWYSDIPAMEDELAAAVQAKVVILRALAGFQLVSVSPSIMRTDIDGGQTLAADIAVTTPVLLT